MPNTAADLNSAAEKETNSKLIEMLWTFRVEQTLIKPNHTIKTLIGA